MNLEDIKKETAARAALNEEIAKIEAAEKAFTDALDAANSDINIAVDEVIRDLRNLGLNPLEPLSNQRINEYNPKIQRVHEMLVAALILRFYPRSTEQYGALKPALLYMIVAIYERRLYITGGSVTVGSNETEDYGAFTTEDIKSSSFRKELREAFNRAIDAMRIVRPPQ